MKIKANPTDDWDSIMKDVFMLLLNDEKPYEIFHTAALEARGARARGDVPSNTVYHWYGTMCGALGITPAAAWAFVQSTVTGANLVFAVHKALSARTNPYVLQVEVTKQLILIFTATQYWDCRRKSYSPIEYMCREPSGTHITWEVMISLKVE